ncbi:MAG: YdcH family protein [Rhizobiaceae bacterium]|nr:YdcH family protein [Rhizobiaceae bacterium]
MPNTPHTLGEDFPGQLEAIHALKAKQPEFARLLVDYDEINDRIHRAETRIEPVDEKTEVEMRKARLSLKDRIAAALNRV